MAIAENCAIIAPYICLDKDHTLARFSYGNFREKRRLGVHKENTTTRENKSESLSVDMRLQGICIHGLPWMREVELR